MNRIYDLWWWWWKLNESYSSKERLWVILSPQVKSLERGMQGPMDGRISPNCKMGYMDPRTAESVQIFNRDQRTADLVLIFKGEGRDQRTVDLILTLKGRLKDPRTADSLGIFERGMKGYTDSWHDSYGMSHVKWIIKPIYCNFGFLVHFTSWSNLTMFKNHMTG